MSRSRRICIVDGVYVFHKRRILVIEDKFVSQKEGMCHRRRICDVGGRLLLEALSHRRQLFIVGGKFGASGGDCAP